MRLTFKLAVALTFALVSSCAVDSDDQRSGADDPDVASTESEATGDSVDLAQTDVDPDIGDVDAAATDDDSSSSDLAVEAGLRCRLFHPANNCYHVVVGHTYGTVAQCRLFGARMIHNQGASIWVRCTAIPPSGRVQLEILSLRCPAGRSYQWCLNHHLQ